MTGTALVALLVASDGAHAQSQAGQDVSTVDEIIVTGSPIVGSQRAALRQQRNAENLINVIAADTVGQFPDQNSAAALARLPAVAVQRDQGQERYLQVRGGPNRWTSVSIDGINIIGVDEAGTARAFRFDAVPAVMLSALEVNKSLTPDLPAEAVLARVNLRTYSPFDRKGLQSYADLGYGQMSLGGGPQRQAAARVSWADDRFGVVAAASHYKREQITDNREFKYDASGLPTDFDFRSYKVARSSDAAMLGFGVRPADGHELTFKSMYSNFNDDEQRNQYVFQLSRARSIQSRTNDRGELIGTPVRGLFEDGQYRNSNWTNTLGGDHRFGEWAIDWRINYTKTENTTYLPIIFQNQTADTQRVSLSYDASDRNFPMLTLYDTIATAGVPARGSLRTSLNQAAFGDSRVLPYTSRIETDSWVYKLDARRTLMWAGREIEFAGGLEYDDRDVDGGTFSVGDLINLNNTAAGLVFTPGDYVTDRAWDTNFARGWGVNEIDNRRMRVDVDKALSVLNIDLWATGKPTDRYTIRERVLAGYVRAKMNFDNAQVVAGLRIEKAEQDIRGVFDATQKGAATKVYAPVTAGEDDTTVFPSINVKFDLADDLVLRLSGQTGVSRPSFAVVRTSASIDDTSNAVTAGNPNLKPEKTWGGDVSLERYLPGSGVVSVSGFYRHVDDVLFSGSDKVSDGRYSTPGLDRAGYNYITTRNGGEGVLHGVEFAYLQQFTFLPGAFDGLGFQGNLSLLSGDFKTPDGKTVDFPGVSDTIVNTSLFYEKYGLSARISWQWRSEWIDTLDFGGYGDQYRDAYQNMDLSLRYEINQHVSVYADANNLTDETYVAYAGDRGHPNEVEQIGRRYMAGLRVRF